MKVVFVVGLSGWVNGAFLRAHHEAHLTNVQTRVSK